MRWALLGLAVLAAVGGIGGVAGARHMHTRALSPTCAELPHVRPSMADVVALAGRMRAYQRDSSENALLALTAAELSYLVGDREELRILTRFVDDQVVARMAVPEGQGCYNITFAGEVRVDDGVAHVVPSHLVVGTLDLGWAVRGMTLTIEPDDVEDDQIRHLLTNTRTMRVAGGRMKVALEERHWPR